MVRDLTDKAPRVSPGFQNIGGKDCLSCAKSRIEYRDPDNFKYRVPGGYSHTVTGFVWCNDLERFEPYSSVCCLWQGTLE